jgi:hypothetical protein
MRGTVARPPGSGLDPARGYLSPDIPTFGIKENSMTHPANTPHAASGGGAYGFVRDGYDRADASKLTTSDVESATVYGRDDESIGSVSSLKVGTDGRITHAVVDVGGFLGIGTHSVLLPFGRLTVLRETDGEDVRIHLDMTKEQLKAMPQHDA